MGRRKITIKQISDPKLRHITFNKRRNGLIKKAAELSLLCNINLLLIFEDGNGNLIQFSRNKIHTIPGFFKECRYSTVTELTANEYPNFFKVNHYKKGKDRDQDDSSSDELDMGQDHASMTHSNGHGRSKARYFNKREKTQGSTAIKEEIENDQLAYYSGSEESSPEDSDIMAPYMESSQIKEHSYNSLKKNPVNTAKGRMQTSEEYINKVVMNKEEVINVTSFMNNQGFSSVSREPAAHTSYNNNNTINIINKQEVNPRIRTEKPTTYPPQFIEYDHHQYYNHNTAPVRDHGSHSYNAHPYPANENTSQQQPHHSQSIINHNYPAYPHVNSNSHPYMQHQNSNSYHLDHPSSVNNSYQNRNRIKGSGSMDMGNNHSGDLRNGATEGFPVPQRENPMIVNPVIAKPVIKPEVNENMMDTASMIKYLNSNGGGPNTFGGPKTYNFHSSNEAEKFNNDHEIPVLLRLRNDHEGSSYDHEHSYHEPHPYGRGSFGHDSHESNMPASLPANLPSAYFSSKKFNFDGSFETFEDDMFNEFNDPKKKFKPW